MSKNCLRRPETLNPFFLQENDLPWCMAIVAYLYFYFVVTFSLLIGLDARLKTSKVMRSFQPGHNRIQPITV
jgi:hypothetical protein